MECCVRASVQEFLPRFCGYGIKRIFGGHLYVAQRSALPARAGLARVRVHAAASRLSRSSCGSAVDQPLRRKDVNIQFDQTAVAHRTPQIPLVFSQ